MYKIKTTIGLIIFTMLQGCASLSKEECQGADWAGIGYQDGSQGLQENRFNDHRKACAEYKIKPDFSTYVNGRLRGLSQIYCKPRKGYTEGLNGRSYGNVCPSYLEAAFLSAYQYGHDIYKLRQDATGLRADLANTHSRIAIVDQEIGLLRQQIQYSQLRLGIRDHIDEEVQQLVDRYEQETRRVMSELHLNKQPERQFGALLNKAEKRGGLQTRLDWGLEYNHYAQDGGYKEPTIRQKIRELDQQIGGVKTDLVQYINNPHSLEQMNRLVGLSGDIGSLEMQLKILRRLYNKREKRDLANFHYQHELAGLSGHGQHNEPNNPHRGKSKQQLLREILEAQQQRDRELHLIDDLTDQLQLLESDIRQQIANSPYR